MESKKVNFNLSSIDNINKICINNNKITIDNDNDDEYDSEDDIYNSDDEYHIDNILDNTNKNNNKINSCLNEFLTLYPHLAIKKELITYLFEIIINTEPDKENKFYINFIISTINNIKSNN